MPSRTAEPGQPTRPGLGNSLASPCDKTWSMRFSSLPDCLGSVRDPLARFLQKTIRPSLIREFNRIGRNRSATEASSKFQELIPESHFNAIFCYAHEDSNIPP